MRDALRLAPGRALGRYRTAGEVALIALVGLLPLTWFRGQLIAGMDLPYTLADPEGLLGEALSLWQTNVGLGTPSLTSRLLVYALVGTGLHRVGLSLLQAEQLLFVSWFAGAGLSAYFMVRALAPGRSLAATVGGLFYMLNPYTMVIRWYELNFLTFFYALVPLALGCFALGLRTRRRRYTVGFLVAATLMTPAHANLLTVVWLWLVLGGYLLTHLAIGKGGWRGVRDSLSYSAVLAGLWLATSIWWLAPGAASLGAEVSIRRKPEGDAAVTAAWTSAETTWDRVLRLEGYWAFNLKQSGTPDAIFPYAGEYNQWAADLAWLIPLLALVGLWQVRRQPGLIWPAILWLDAVFFMKGMQPPFGETVARLYTAFPTATAPIRHPFDKFGMLAILGLAPLVGIGLWRVAALARRWRPGHLAATALLAGTLLGAAVWPFWTGDLISPGGAVAPPLRVTVPAEYDDARAWLAADPADFRTMPLPYNRIFWTFSLLKWYGGHDPTRMLLGRPLLSPSYFSAVDLVEGAVAGTLGEPDDRVGRLLGLLNVKYVLVHQGVNWPLLTGNAAETQRHLYLPEADLEPAVAGQPWLEPAARFGDLTFYRNRYWQPLAAYATGDALVVSASPDGGLTAADAADALGRAASDAPVVLIDEAEAGRLGVAGAGARSATTSPPTFTVEQAEPWSARVTVESGGPFSVVLSQAFDPGWRAYSGESSWAQRLAGQGDAGGAHFVANGYANGWYFDRPGRYDLTLYFLPQLTLYLGFAVSAIAWLLIGASLAVGELRRRSGSSARSPNPERTCPRPRS